MKFDSYVLESSHPLILDLKYGDEAKRILAAQRLGDLGYNADITNLLSVIMTDSSEKVRAAAALSLYQLHSERSLQSRPISLDPSMALFVRDLAYHFFRISITFEANTDWVPPYPAQVHGHASQPQTSN